MAELEHPRTTGPSGMTSSSIGGMQSTIGGQGLSSGGCGTTSWMMGGVTTSTSSHALTNDTGGLCNTSNSYTVGGVNVSPLPVRAHQMSTIPPLCQV